MLNRFYVGSHMPKPTLKKNNVPELADAGNEKISDHTEAITEEVEDSTLPEPTATLAEEAEDNILANNEEASPKVEDNTLLDTQQSHSHEIDAGMVEVSLGLAALVFTVATITTNVSDLSLGIFFAFFILVILSNFTALWALAAYCVRQGIIQYVPDAWKNPKSIIVLITSIQNAGVYWMLSFCIIVLTFMSLFITLDILI